jgi:hypothetical protein
MHAYSTNRIKINGNYECPDDVFVLSRFARRRVLRNSCTESVDGQFYTRKLKLEQSSTVRVVAICNLVLGHCQ